MGKSAQQEKKALHAGRPRRDLIKQGQDWETQRENKEMEGGTSIKQLTIAV